MQLKKIEITGFKSFQKKTVIEFQRPKDPQYGLTAIVGPNGSGKSNVCDALKWGLGGQSKKGFRSKKSRDVIFSGSDLKKPLTSAMVALFFDNRGKKVDLDYPEVIISRKIYASGENEYFINDSWVRLKRILEILGQAGIGQESYSIVDQGMADRLIMVGPLERKKIIEEAAKVKHFQIKKENSIQKLDKARLNRERVEALKKEIEPRLKYLKAQANKKQEQEQWSAKLKEKSREYYGTLWNDLQEKKSGYVKNRRIIEQEWEAVKQALDKNRRQLDQSQSERKAAKTDDRERQWREQLEELRVRENRGFKEISIAEGQIEVLKEKIKFQQSMSEQRVDIGYVRERLEFLVKQIDEVQSSKSLLEKGLTRIRQLALRLKEEIVKGVIKKDTSSLVEKLEKEISAKEKEIEAARKKLAALTKERDELNQKIQQQRQEETRRQADFYEGEQELLEKTKKKEELGERLNLVDIELAKIEVKESDLKRKIRDSLGIEAEKLNYTGPGARHLEKLGREVEEIMRQISLCESIEETVIEEFEETRKRFDFLIKEAQDIKETSVALRKIIKELEVKVESRFAKTFAEIDRKFSRFFKIIFRGGTAKLVKVEVPVADNSGEEAGGEEQKVKTQTGIEIRAVPPGKKIKNIGMLSGGEKALTSLAFLFAMIASSAPPFVMLDEVDAALDEANSERFSRILRMMAEKTQFVMITHNREVMKSAQLLYGVTMGKDGVSKLLSLDLEKK